MTEKKLNRQDIREFFDGGRLSRPPVWATLFLEACARRYGVPWVSEVKEELLVRICREAGFDRFQYLTLDMSCSLYPNGPSLDGDVVEWDIALVEEGNRRTATARLETPYGELMRVAVETQGAAPQVCKHPVERPEDLCKYEWYLDQWLEHGESRAAEHTRKLREMIGPDDFLVLEGIGPLEMCGMTELIPRIHMMHDAPKEFFHAEEKTLEVSRLQATAVLKNGADAIFFGVRGSEIYSPRIFEEHLLALVPQVVEAAHEAGGYLFVHACGRNTDFVRRGLYQRLGCDLFDGLAPPPEGDVEDLPELRRLLGPEVCSRGDLSVAALVHSTPGEVREMVHALLAKVEGYRHIVGASCAVSPITPWENIQAMADAVQDSSS